MSEPIFPPLKIEDESRRAMVANMTKLGLTSAQANEVADLGIHAASEAMAKLEDVCARASSVGGRLTALQVAFSIMGGAARRNNDALLNIAARSGGVTTSTPVHYANPEER